MSPGTTPSDVYIEFTAVGTVQKCTAIDGRTGLEVSVMGPIQAARYDLERLALAKLKRRLEQGAR
jgi:hypothetical protein